MANDLIPGGGPTGLASGQCKPAGVNQPLVQANTGSPWNWNSMRNGGNQYQRWQQWQQRFSQYQQPQQPYYQPSQPQQPLLVA